MIVCSSSCSNNLSFSKSHTHFKTHAILTEAVFFFTQQQFYIRQIAYSFQLICEINSWSVSSPRSFNKSYTHFKMHAVLTEGVFFITQQQFKFQQVTHSFQDTCDINNFCFSKSHAYFKTNAVLTEGVFFIMQQQFQFFSNSTLISRHVPY